MAAQHLHPLAFHPNYPLDVARPLGMVVLHHQTKEAFYLVHWVEEETFYHVHHLERVVFHLSQNPFHLSRWVVLGLFHTYHVVVSILFCPMCHHDVHLVLALVVAHLPIWNAAPQVEANVIQMGACLYLKEPHWSALPGDMGVFPRQGHVAAILQFASHFDQLQNEYCQ